MVDRVGGGNLRENREDPAPTVGIAGIPLRQTERFWVVRCSPLIVTRRATSLQTHPVPQTSTIPATGIGTPPHRRRGPE